MATASEIIADSMTVNRASTANSRKMISTPKNTPVTGALKVAEMPPAAPQATMIRSRFSGSFTHWPRLEASAEPIWTIGPSRPTEPPVPMHIAEARDLTTADLPADPAAVVGDRDHHLGHPVPARLPRPLVDQRPVQQPADHRDDHEEAQAEPRQVGAAHVPGLPELAVPGRQPGEEVDQVPERHRAEPGPRPHHERQQEQATAACSQPAPVPGPCLPAGARSPASRWPLPSFPSGGSALPASLLVSAARAGVPGHVPLCPVASAWPLIPWSR